MVPDSQPRSSAERPLGALAGPALCVLVGALTWLACSDPEDAPPGADAAEESDEFAGYPPTAVLSTVKNLKESQAAPKHPTDGGGRGYLVDGPTEVTISTRHTWTIGYEAGPLGVPEGGVVFFMPSPFWGWDDAPQTSVPEAPGYTEVTTAADGIELELLEYGEVLGIRIDGRDLEAGEECDTDLVDAHFGELDCTTIEVIEARAV